MKKNESSFQKKVADIKVTLNPELKKYEGQILFPEKLAKANEALKRNPIPAEILSKR